ncbi:MAG: HAD-IA family hydrolase [archaeon]
MVKKQGIKAVIFDVGGVLALGKKHLMYKKGKYHNSGVYEYVVKKLNISPDQYLDSIDTSYAKSIVGEISRSKVLSILAKNFKTIPKKIEKIYLKAYKKNFNQNKELYKTAFRLKKAGYKIAILSDQGYISQEALMLKKYTQKFDVMIVSCEVGVRKLNPKIYKLVLKKLKIPAKNCIFIDNQDWNINSAKKLGIKTILFKNNKQTLNKLSKFLKCQKI